MKRFLVLLVLLAGLAWAKPVADVEQRLALTEDPLPFGKPAELVLTLSWPTKANFEAPDPSSLQIANATLIDSYQVDLGNDGVRKTVEYHLLFTVFEPGDFEVAPISLGEELQSRPLKMTWAGSTPQEGDKEGEIRGPKQVVELSTLDFWLELLKWLVIGLLTILLLAFLLNQSGLLDRFRSPRSLALRDLKRLRKKLDADPLLVLLGCVEVLRRYLYKGYGIEAHNFTASETVDELTLDNRCGQIRGPAAELLQLGDQVKFAGLEVTGADAERVLEHLTSTLSQEGKVPPK